MLRSFLISILILGLAGCGTPTAPTVAPQPIGEKSAHPDAPTASQVSSVATLVEARKNFKTKLVPKKSDRAPAANPPENVFLKVKYDSSAGPLTAYITPDPKDGHKHPAIVWITGGDCNSIYTVWMPAHPSNDQTAAAYRKAGIVMMFPSLRGGNDNPGAKEGFYGEVDDVLDAAQYLSKLPYVDPDRIYLGGHSTGGTMVLLVAECSNRFRAIFSFGPMSTVARYAAYDEMLPFDTSNPNELEVRAPGKWLNCIQSPVFVMEGTVQGNGAELQKLMHASTNPKVHFIPLTGATHFSGLAIMNTIIARKILSDTGQTCTIEVTAADVPKSFPK